MKILLLALLFSTNVSNPAERLFSIDAEASIENESGEIKLHIIPKEGYKWGEKYPAKLFLENGKKVKFPKLAFFNKEGAFKQYPRKVTVTIPIKPIELGEETITGKLTCLICNDTVCKVFRNIKIEFPVIVK